MTNAHETIDKILDHNRLQLSALIDGELAPEQARFLLRRLQHDAELGGCWERWQLCGDVLRGQVGTVLPADFAGQVADRIRLEHVRPESGAATRRAANAGTRGLRWGGGVALAASAAVIALLLMRQSPNALSPGAVVPAQVAAVLPATGAPAGSTTPAPATAMPSSPDRAGQLLAAVAAADVPRRLATRRSRGQSQRAALRAGMSQSIAHSAVAASATATTIVTIPADPFAARQLNLSSRPWPRALLPGAAVGGVYTVDYGSRTSGNAASPSFYPFAPRPFPSTTELPADAGYPP